MVSKGVIALPFLLGYLQYDSSEYSADRLSGVVSRVFFCDRCCPRCPQPKGPDPIDHPADRLWNILGEAI